MVDITLDTGANPQENEEEQNVNAVVPPPPQITPVDETPPPPPEEENLEPDMVVRVPQDEDTGIAQGLAPDPYMQSSGPAAQELFRYRPEVGVFTKERGFGEDTVTSRQDEILSKSLLFYPLPDENGVVGKPKSFLPEDDLGTRYRKLLRNEGGFLQDIDENGNPVFLDNGQPKLVPLSTTIEYMRYTQGKPETITGQIAQTVASAFTGPTGAGDLAAVDEKLKEYGMTNQIARTAVLRGIATGRYSGEDVTRDLEDIGVFITSIPPLAVDGVKNISAELGAFAAREWLGFNTEDAEQIAEDIRGSGGFEVAKDAVNFKNHLELQYFTEEKAGGIYAPEVIEEAFGTRGLYNTAVRHATTEGALYGVWGAYRVYSAAKRMKGFNKYLETEFETSDLATAFQKAREDKGLTPRQVVDNFIEENFHLKVREKVQRDLDLAIGMSIRKPSPARAEVLRDQMLSMEDEIGRRREVYHAAVAQGNKDFAEREYKAIERLMNDRRALLHKELTPKYMRDLTGEAGITVGAMTAANELSVQMYSTQEDVWMAEAGAAIVASFNLGRLDLKENAVGLARFGGVVLSELSEAYDSVRHGNFSFREFYADMKKRGKSREALALLRNVGKQNSEYTEMFMQGLRASAERRSELVVLAEDYGVDIDVDLFSNNLATMSGISTLMDVARQLDDTMTITGIKDVAEPIANRQQLIYDQAKLVSQLATATRKLLDLKLTANLGDDHPVSLMADGMRNFVSTNMNRLNEDKLMIDGLIAENRKRVEFALRTDTIAPKDGGLEVTTMLDDTYRLETEAAISSISNSAEMGLDVSQEQLQETLKRLDQLKQDNLEMMARMKNGLRIGESQTAEASGTFAHAVTNNRGVIDANVAKMYAAFDSEYGDVASDMKSFFDEVILGTDEAGFIAEKEFTAEAAKLAGFDMIPSQKKGLAVYFNGAAKRSLEDVVNAQLGGRLTQITDDLEISELSPLQKWMEIRRIAREEPSRLNLSEQDGLDLAEGMPLLVSPADWRKINKVISKTLRKSSDDRQQYYFGVFDQWQLVSNPESPTAFKRGWYGGQPANVAEEVYAKFREAQDYYRTEVINRYNGSTLTRKIDGVLDQDVKDAAVVDEATMLAEMEDVPDELLPYYWMSTLTKQVLQKNKGSTLDGMTRGQALHTEFYSAFSRLGGAYDPKTKQYYILSESDLPDDADVLQIGDTMRVALLRHLQGILASNNKNVLPRVGKTDKVRFNPFEEIAYDKDAFQSFYNIPKYRRNKDGTITPILKADGTPEMMFTEEEVFESISLRALETNRDDLNEVFEEADKLVQEMEADLKSEYGSYEDMITQTRQDIKFTEVLFREVLGGDLPSEMEAGGKLTLRNTEDQVSAALYQKIVEGESLDYDRLKGILKQQGYEEEYTDELIKRLVNTHLVNMTNKQVGSFKTKVDGVETELPILELDSQKVLEVLGEPGSAKRKRLENLLGEDVVDTWNLIGDTISQIDPKVNKSGVSVRTSSISLDSVLSRIYNINRGVVSPQWVATESIIRASRQHGGKLLTAMLTDREIAKEVLNIIQTGNIPKYKVQPDWLRVLTVQIMQAEAKNEAYWEADRMRGELPEGVSPGVPEATPNILQQNIELMESPEKLQAIAERQRVTPEDVKKKLEDELNLEMKSYGFDPKYLQNVQE